MIFVLKKSALVLFLLVFLVSCSAALMRTMPEAVAENYIHEDVRIHFRDSGTGSALVFIHGFGASHETWRYLEESLKSEHRVILLDLKGHGRSDRPLDDRYSLHDHAKIVLGLMNYLNLKNVILVGHSFGCAVALMAALEAQGGSSPGVTGLVLISGSVDPENLPFYLRLLRVPVIGWLAVKLTPVDFGTRLILNRAYHDDEKVTESLVERYAKYQRLAGTDHALLMTARQMVPSDAAGLREKLQTLNLPVLKIIGKHDEIVSPDSSEALCRMLPSCTAVTVDGVGHVPHEEKPEETIPLIRRFVSKLS